MYKQKCEMGVKRDLKLILYIFSTKSTDVTLASA